MLIHEVYNQASFEKVSPSWQQYRLAYHTSSKALAEIAARTKPGLLVLYRRAHPGCDQARQMSARKQQGRSNCGKKCDGLTKEKWSQITKFTDAQ